jgi:hypothetical protein
MSPKFEYDNGSKDPFRPNSIFKGDGDQEKKGLFSNTSYWIIGILITLTIGFEVYLQLEDNKFYMRFLDAITTNQKQVFLLNRNRFEPQFNDLVALYRNSPESPRLMRQMELVDEISFQLTDATNLAAQQFEYDDFSEVEQSKIHNFFVALGAFDRARMDHVAETNECIRMQIFNLTGADDFCEAEDIRFTKQMPKLQQELFDSLQLPEKKREIFKNNYLRAMRSG